MSALRIVFAFAALLGLSSVVAQNFPSRAVTLVVPFPASGPTDTLARLISEPMKKSLGQAVVVENVSGAAGAIALARVARAAPDGYTVILGNWTSNVGSPALRPLQIDVLKDFEAVSRLPSSRLWIVGRNGLPPGDAADLIAWLKANPDKASFGIVGTGSAAHVCALYFANRTGTRFQVVPYRGAAPAYQDLIAGNLDLTCADAATSLGYLRSGRIKAYAVLGAGRWQPAAAVPTLDEVGVSGLDLSLWTALWVPKSTPREAVEKLNAAAVAALADATLRQRFEDLGLEVPPVQQQTPEALAAFHKSEVEKWWPVIKAAGISSD